MRLTLAVLLAFGPLPAEAREPVFDALSHLLNEYAGPVDQKAAEAAPEESGPPGVKLAQVQSDLSLMGEGFEVFRHPSHTTQALTTLPEKIVLELRPFFKDRDSSLDTIYRTLAVTDYTWASRFPEPPCDPRARRRAILSSKDGLFTDPKTGELSAWLARLLGPAAYGHSAEDALDTVSSKMAPTGRDYELLRLKVRKISEALESDKAVGAARSKLYCARAQAYEDLASAHRSVADGPIQAALSQDGKESSAPDKQAASVVLMAILEGPDQYRSLGAGVLVDTGMGPRVLTDARLLPERDEAKPSLRAFARPEDGKTLGAPLLFLVEKIDQASGVMVGRLEGGDHIPALKLAGAEPALNDLVRAIGHMSGTGAWTVSQGLVTAAGKGTFTTDALLGPDMLGSPLINDQGEVAGLAVLPNGTGAPAAVTAALLSALLAGGPQVTASSDIEFIESQNRGSASVLTAAMPTFGAGLSAPGAKPLEASQYIYSQTQWGTVRGKCMANCGGGSSSSGSSYSGSSYDSGGKELGEALGKALAPVVEALIFKGIPALFHGIGSLFSKNRTAASPPARPSTLLEQAKVPPKPPEKPKEPARLIGVTIEASPTTAAPGEKVTLIARVTLSDPEAPKGNIPVNFKAAPETLARFDAAPQSKTNAEGIATISATIRRDHGVRTVKTGDMKAVIGKSEGAQSDLDDEVRAMSEAQADSAEPGMGREKAESITFEASANVKNALSAKTAVIMSDVQAKPECKFEVAEVPESFGNEPFAIKVRFSCTKVNGLPEVPLDGHTVTLALNAEGIEGPQTVTLQTDSKGYAFALFQATGGVRDLRDQLVRGGDQEQFVNAANPSSVRDLVEPAQKVATDPVFRQFVMAGAATAIEVAAALTLTGLAIGAVVVVGGTAVAVTIVRKEMRADQKLYEKGLADSKKPANDSNSQGTGRSSVRIQAQGADMATSGGVSEVIDQIRPICLNSGLAALANVQQRLTTRQLAARDQALPAADNFMRRASTSGGVGPSENKFQNRPADPPDARIDVTVLRGLAFVDCSALKEPRK